MDKESISFTAVSARLFSLVNCAEYMFIETCLFCLHFQVSTTTAHLTYMHTSSAAQTLDWLFAHSVCLREVYFQRVTPTHQTIHCDLGIFSGEAVLQSYCTPNWPRAQRQAYLRTGYLFTCACERCAQDLALDPEIASQLVEEGL